MPFDAVSLQLCLGPVCWAAVTFQNGNIVLRKHYDLNNPPVLFEACPAGRAINETYCLSAVYVGRVMFRYWKTVAMDSA
jgi:hypothetical protein